MKRTLALKLLLGMVLMAWALPASAQLKQPVAATQPLATGGERTCLTCHGADTKVTAILKTPHAVKGDPRTPFGQNGCESCHGAGGDHAALKAKSPSVVFKGPHISPAAVRNQECLGCHQSGLRMNWQGSQHQRD